jgi:hypothetical protein
VQTNRDQPIDIAQLVTEGSAIDDALKRARRAALMRHKQLGVPVAVWRNGRTEWIPPEQIDALLQQSESSTQRR